MANREKLGNSLQSLLGDAIGIGAETTSKNITKISMAEIQQSETQPRKRFDEEQMNELMKSIEEHGILQPIIVSPKDKGYKIIAGERRWRAAKQLGLKEIPVNVKNADGMKALELALVENIQREDLNPIEKANAYVELKKQFGLTHEKIALRIGQDRSSIANTIRLLDLAENIQELVSRGTISMGHARALLSLKDPKKQKILSYKIVTDGLSVREVEMIASGRKTFIYTSKKDPDTKIVSSKLYKSPQICDLENKLREFIGARVTIQEKSGKGKIIIAFSNNSQFENITEKLETLMKTPIE